MSTGKVNRRLTKGFRRSFENRLDRHRTVSEAPGPVNRMMLHMADALQSEPDYTNSMRTYGIIVVVLYIGLFLATVAQLLWR